MSSSYPWIHSISNWALETKREAKTQIAPNQFRNSCLQQVEQVKALKIILAIHYPRNKASSLARLKTGISWKSLKINLLTLSISVGLFLCVLAFGCGDGSRVGGCRESSQSTRDQGVCWWVHILQGPGHHGKKWRDCCEYQNTLQAFNKSHFFLTFVPRLKH